MCSEALWNEESGNVLAPAIVVACVAWWDLGLCLGSLCLRVYGDLEKGRGGGEEREEEGEKKIKREMGRRGEKRRARLGGVRKEPGMKFLFLLDRSN